MLVPVINRHRDVRNKFILGLSLSLESNFPGKSHISNNGDLGEYSLEITIVRQVTFNLDLI